MSLMATPSPQRSSEVASGQSHGGRTVAGVRLAGLTVSFQRVCDMGLLGVHYEDLPNHT
jgi:hypothetical protein